MAVLIYPGQLHFHLMMLNALVVIGFAASADLQPDDLPYAQSTLPSGSEGPVFVVNTDKIGDGGDKTTLQTLAGVLARHSPQIYTVNSDPNGPGAAAADTTVFWLEQLKAQNKDMAFSEEFLGDFTGLLGHFKANITSYVKYSTAASSVSTNAALIRCAAEPGNAIAVSNNATISLLEGMGIKMAADVSASTVYDEYMQQKDKLNDRMMCTQPDDGSKSQSLSDYAVFARIPTIEDHSGGSQAFFAGLKGLSKDKLNAVFGWTSWDEHQWVSHITQEGGVAHASDFANNLAFLTNVKVPERPTISNTATSATSTRTTSPITSGRNGGAVHTVAFLTSDGDNIQLLEHQDFIGPNFYGSKHRGEVPLGWSYSPSMAVLMPTVLNYVQTTLTANDSLAAGPSGAGYCYPQLFPSDGKQAAAFGRVTAELMRRANQTIASVIGVTPSAESLAMLVAQEQVEGIIYFTFGPADMGYAALHGNVAYLNGKPVVGARLSLWGDAEKGDKVGVTGLVRQLKALPKDPADPNSYSVIVSELGNHYTEIMQAVEELEQDGTFDIVLPGELFQRLVKNTNKKEQCPMPGGKWGSQVSDLPKCSFAGNGSCVMTCNEVGKIPIPISCDLSTANCRNLSLAANHLSFKCEDGKTCPRK